MNAVTDLPRARTWAPSRLCCTRRPGITVQERRTVQAAAMANSGAVYIVLVQGKLKAGRMAEFKEYFKPLADYVTANEPGCLTYQLAVGAEDRDSLIIYERYTSQQYLEEVHWKSEPFQTFGAKVRAADIWESKSVQKLWEEPPGSYGYHTK